LKKLEKINFPPSCSKEWTRSERKIPPPFFLFPLEGGDFLVAGEEAASPLSPFPRPQKRRTEASTSFLFFPPFQGFCGLSFLGVSTFGLFFFSSLLLFVKNQARHKEEGDFSSSNEYRRKIESVFPSFLSKEGRLRGRVVKSSSLFFSPLQDE